MPNKIVSRSSSMHSDEFAVKHEGEVIKIKVARRASARRVSLRVSTVTGDVVITLPPRGSLERARAFAETNGGWIAQRLRRLPERVQFEHGAVIPFRGKPLRIVHRAAQRGVAEITTDAAGERILVIPCAAPHLSRRVREFLARQAARHFTAAAERYARMIGHEVRKVTVKDTVSRWGSCSSSGRLSFSWRIIFAPPMVLDYLAAHEVAHLKEMNHSTRYWRIVASLFPEWKEAERWLKRNGASLHRYG